MNAATAPDPGDRYAGVEALRADIQRFLSQEPLKARRPGWSYVAGKFVRRCGRELAAAALLSTSST